MELFQLAMGFYTHISHRKSPRSQLVPLVNFVLCLNEQNLSRNSIWQLDVTFFKCGKHCFYLNIGQFQFGAWLSYTCECTMYAYVVSCIDGYNLVQRYGSRRLAKSSKIMPSTIHSKFYVICAYVHSTSLLTLFYL